MRHITTMLRSLRAYRGVRFLPALGRARRGLLLLATAGGRGPAPAARPRAARPAPRGPRAATVSARGLGLRGIAGSPGTNL